MIGMMLKIQGNKVINSIINSELLPDICNMNNDLKG